MPQRTRGVLAHLIFPKCRLLVVKATERCNLNCSYCYMFNGGDQSYRNRPPIMTMRVVKSMMARAASHCRRHKLPEFAFVLHGGEPLIAKPQFYRDFVSAAYEAFGSDVKPIFALQTNGTLLTADWCKVFQELEIRVSFSLDGPKAVNDRFRMDKRGMGSFERVMTGWKVAKSSGLDPGLLMVVNVESDPVKIYDLIRELDPSTVDFLLPDATYEKLPPGYPPGFDETPYADWLLKIFDIWYEESRWQKAPKVRMFLQIMRSIMGKADGYDVLGKGDIEVLVIESDGEIQPLDGLRYCEDGIANTAFNVLHDELDSAYQVPLIRTYHKAHTWLCATCRSCEIADVCGGGFLPHRFKSDNGFNNPSLYCRDLFKLISSVKERLADELPVAMST